MAARWSTWRTSSRSGTGKPRVPQSPLPPIRFGELAAALLRAAEQLVPQWLPGGRRDGAEYKCASLRGGAGRSFSVNMLTGRWGEFEPGGQQGGDLLSLYAAIHDLSMAKAALQVAREEGLEDVAGIARPPGRAVSPAPPTATQAAAPAADRKVRWQPIAPVPEFAPPAAMTHHSYGEPQRWWRYELCGRLYGYVLRFDRTEPDGTIRKEVLPLTFCRDLQDPRGSMRWTNRQWDEPRPLYLPRGELHADPALVPVVVVEGEKCVQAGDELLGAEFDFVTWPGGGKAWPKADWPMLQGRVVYLWADCDCKRVRLTPAEAAAGIDAGTEPLLPEDKQPGVQAMRGLGELLAGQYGCTVLWVPIPAPGQVPDGWDLADAIADGWDAARVRDFIRSASPFGEPAVARAGGTSTPTTAAAGESGDTRRRSAPTWWDCLLLTEKGHIAAARENVVMALDGWPDRGIPGIEAAQGLIVFNEFSNNVEKTRVPPWGGKAGVWEEQDELDMGAWLVHEHRLPSMSRSTLEEAVLMVSRRHARHPVRERMLALRGKWDGQHRLRWWLARCCLERPPDGFDPQDSVIQYLARAGQWFLMAYVARVLPVEKIGARVVRGPGTKFDYMLILEGSQGLGKTTLANVLGGDYFANTGLTLGEKDSYQNIQGVHVYEWAELDNMARADVSKVKAFVSSDKDRFRASFDRRPRDYPRQVVFVGTVNEDHYLTDPTGNRRYWPVRCTRPTDIDWLSANLDQLIAEALERLDAGERFWPTREEQRDLFDPQQQQRVVPNSLESAIREYLYDEDQRVPQGGENGSLVGTIGLKDLLQRVGYTLDKQTPALNKQASAVMHRLGWELKRAPKGPLQASRPYHYVRPATVPEARASESTSNAPTQGKQPSEAEHAGMPF